MDTPAKTPVLNRRGFLIAAAGTGVAFSFLTACESKDDAASASTAPAYEPTQWYSIDNAGIVTVNVIRAEMGQHVGTSLARILADELEAPWENVRVHHVDSDPKWGLMVTGGSWSVWQTYPLYSQAGAAGRAALIEAGAAALGVDPSTCTAANGEIVSGGKKISYRDIVRKGGLTKTYTPEELGAITLKPVAERKLIGKPVTSVDIVEKTTGAAIYGIDAKVEGMVYGRPIIPPTRNGSKANSVDDSAAKAVKGYLQSVILEDPSNTVPGWVMVIAESYPAAKKAADLVKVDWTPGPTANISEKDLQAHSTKLIAKADAGSWHRRGPHRAGRESRLFHRRQMGHESLRRIRSRRGDQASRRRPGTSATSPSRALRPAHRALLESPPASLTIGERARAIPSSLPRRAPSEHAGRRRW